MTNKTLLHINTSGRYQDSVTRQQSEHLVGMLVKQHPHIVVQQRDVAKGLPFLNQDWIHANFTEPQERSSQQQQQLSLSDQLVAELQQAEILVIAVPIYNFGIPAVLKAWIDQIARARLTFKYTDKGPVGLLTTRKAYIVAASGGVPIGSDADFATRYLQHVLGFVGINDVTVIDAVHTDINDIVNQNVQEHTTLKTG